MKSFLLSSLILIFTTISASANDNRFTKERDTGKWLVTISVGLGMPEDPTLAMSKVLDKIFTQMQGGYYKHAFDMHDHPTENEATVNRKYETPSKENLIKSFNILNAEMKRFKNRHPKEKKVVVIGLTGHGLTDENGEYTYAIERFTSLTGDEILKILTSLEADEIILILQSCQSGTLANDVFGKFAESLGKKAKLYSKRTNKGIAVLTPVHKFINSPIYDWENILERAFSKASDNNHNKVITFEEWVNAVFTESRKAPHYKPKYLYNGEAIDRLKKDTKKISEPIWDDLASQRIFGDSGLAPQLFMYNMDANTPLFLTKRGASLISKNQFKLPAQPPFKKVEFYKDVNQLETMSKQITNNIIIFTARAYSAAEKENAEEGEKLNKILYKEVQEYYNSLPIIGQKKFKALAPYLYQEATGENPYEDGFDTHDSEQAFMANSSCLNQLIKK